jgi:predicted secreted hydrolase
LQRRDAADDSSTSVWTTSVDAPGFALDLEMRATQPLLLQGDAGFSRKGPDEAQASHYYSEPQLEVRGRLTQRGSRGGHGGASNPPHTPDTPNVPSTPNASSPPNTSTAPTIRTTLDVQGRAWLDHEWSDTLMPNDAIGWDWIGMNLDDGRALTAFQLRRADGSAAWAGGSVRAPGAVQAQAFDANAVRFTQPLRRWRSAATGADYPVAWRIDCPAGVFEVRSLVDDQEIDARASTGTVYWEGLAALHDAQGVRVGWGYLEMTGYVGRLRV